MIENHDILNINTEFIDMEKNIMEKFRQIVFTSPNVAEFLEKELLGYQEYKQKVKYRLIPFLW